MPDDIGKRKYYVAGYNLNNPASGVLDTPYAHAVWLDDNSGRGGVVFVSIDNVGMLSDDVNFIRDSLRSFVRETGCRSVNIMSTHSHAGIDTMGIWGPLPLTGRDKRYMELVRAGVRTAVLKAYGDRRDGDLYHGTVEVPDMQKDNRTPYVYSKTLTRLRFAPRDGSRDIYIVNFASHSESLTGDNSLVSADFPGYFRDKIRRQTGAETVYFVGAIGGMITMKLLDEDRPKSTRMIGENLADYALSIKKEKKLKPDISFMTQRFYFEADNTVLMLAGITRILKVSEYCDKQTSLGYCLMSEMSYFEIGGLKLLLLPCELFPELAFGGFLPAEESATGKGAEVNPAVLTDICGDDKLLIFGLANDEVGYVIPPNDFLLDESLAYLERAKDIHGRNHYEETNSLGPKTALTIAETFEKMYNAAQQAKTTLQG